jgi:hypothetical protein
MHQCKPPPGTSLSGKIPYNSSDLGVWRGILLVTVPDYDAKTEEFTLPIDLSRLMCMQFAKFINSGDWKCHI